MVKFWECDCCTCIIVIASKDDASKYECPQCKIAKCSEPGVFVEITKEAFMKEAGLQSCAIIENEH